MNRLKGALSRAFLCVEVKILVKSMLRAFSYICKMVLELQEEDMKQFLERRTKRNHVVIIFTKNVEKLEKKQPDVFEVAVCISIFPTILGQRPKVFKFH